MIRGRVARAFRLMVPVVGCHIVRQLMMIQMPCDAKSSMPLNLNC